MLALPDPVIQKSRDSNVANYSAGAHPIFALTQPCSQHMSMH